MRSQGRRHRNSRDNGSAGKAPGPRVRIQKALAQAGVASRRACEVMVEEGRVAVNGEIVSRLPVLIDPASDRVTVDEVTIRFSGPASRHLYILLNKPRRAVSTVSDPGGRRTVTDLVQHPSGARLYPVGRLDYDTMGLLLLTNDGDLAERLTHPRFGVEQTYRAVVRGAMTELDIERLEMTMRAKSRRSGHGPGAYLRLVRTESQRSIIDITLREGRNKQVGLMLARAGFPVRKLTRTALGPLELTGVAVSQWRELAPGEVRALRRAASQGAKARAGGDA